MGTVISTAAVVYNMAGDTAGLQKYMRTLLTPKFLANNKESYTQTISNGLLKGPSARMRSTFNWMNSGTNYSEIGVPSGQVSYEGSVDLTIVASNITVLRGETIVAGDIVSVEIGGPTPVFWADRWIRANQDNDWYNNWQVSINEALTQLTIYHFTRDISNYPTITAPLYDVSGVYMYVVYDRSSPSRPTNGVLYKYGTGRPQLDTMIAAATGAGSDYFPSIPVRRFNQFLSASYKPTAFAQATKAYKRALGGAKLSDLVAVLADNANLGDIDHAFVVFAVPLNTTNNYAKEYLYRLFESLMLEQEGGIGGYDAWVAAGSSTSSAARNTLKVQDALGYTILMTWRYMVKVTGIGLGKPGAQVGEFWFQKNGTIAIGDRIRLYWQISPTEFAYMAVIGLHHKNEVVPGNYVETGEFGALDDTEVSSFLVPINHSIWRSMGLLATAEMAQECVYLVLNCISTRKLQWYENSAFGFILIIVIAVGVAIFTGGTGIGLLGASLTLGTSLGFTGMTAAIIGSIVNALAAMVLVSLLDPVLQNAFGSLGPVVSAIIIFAISAAAGSFTSTGSITINWGDLLRADNLLAMTSALGQGVSNQINADTLKLQQSGLDYQENAQLEINKIQQAFFDEFGYGAGVIDPMMLVDAPKGPIAESSSTFLTRTLMTGSEIAEMSRQLLYEFPAYSLKLPDAFT